MTNTIPVLGVLSRLLGCLVGFIPAVDPFVDKQDIFVTGEDPAYNIYHIPGIVVTAKGTILAWCEARKRPAGVSDWDDIRILLRRSTDEGKTWSPPKSIVNVEGKKAKNPFALKLKNLDPADVTYNNPVLQKRIRLESARHRPKSQYPAQSHRDAIGAEVVATVADKKWTNSGWVVAGTW